MWVFYSLFNLLAVFTYFWGGGGGFKSLAPFITYMNELKLLYSFLLSSGAVPPKCTLTQKVGVSVQELNVFQPIRMLFGLGSWWPINLVTVVWKERKYPMLFLQPMRRLREA